MNKIKNIFLAIAVLFSANTLQSCSDNDDNYDANQMIAVVTVRPPSDDNDLELRLNKSTVLKPINLSKSPFEDKTVRALLTCRIIPQAEAATSSSIPVEVTWIDSIRTKAPVVTFGENNTEKYGDDAIEVIKDWVTVAEDGFLTLRVRTIWGNSSKKHELNLVQGVNPENPWEFEIRHNAYGDVIGTYGDALIAFDLNKLTSGEDISGKTITLRWKSFNGTKTHDFVMDADNVKPEPTTMELAESNSRKVF